MSKVAWTMRSAMLWQKHESSTEVEFSDTGISDIKVAKSGRQGVLGIHPSLKGWEKLDLAQKQELLAPFQVVLQELWVHYAQILFSTSI